jgi:protease PrsW
MDPMILKIIISLVPVVACLGVFVMVDVFKLVPLTEIGVLLVAGAAMAGACYFIAGGVMDTFPLQDVHSFSHYSQYVAPPIEETMKAVLVVGLFAFNRIGYLIDAAIAGFAIGAGFSLAENIFYLHQFADADMAVWLVRGLGTAIMHGGATAIVAVLAQVLYAPRLRAAADSFRFNIFLFLPGLLGAVALHAAFNHFTDAPLMAMAIVLVAVPIAIISIFSLGERYARRWLAAGHGAHAKLLEDIDNGAFALTPDGRAVQALADRLDAAGAADILDYIRTHTELVVQAEDRLMALEDHEVLAREAKVREQFKHLHTLEKRLGRSVVLAARQHLRFSRNDLWEMHELEEHAPSAHHGAA